MINEILKRLPDTKGAIVLLSGGMDSTIAMRFAVEKYGKDNVKSLSFYYGQKQKEELKNAYRSSIYLGVEWRKADIPFLHDCSLGISANVDKDIKMPTIQDVLGDPTPKTEVPNRNAILLHLAAAYSQQQGLPTIICGLQVHDLYQYGDCSQEFVDSINLTLRIKNRKIHQEVIAPFTDLSKTDEIKLLLEIDGNVNLLKNTMTCYNPFKEESCGKCPSCAERLKAFQNIGIEDPIKYVFNSQ